MRHRVQKSIGLYRCSSRVRLPRYSCPVSVPKGPRLAEPPVKERRLVRWSCLLSELLDGCWRAAAAPACCCCHGLAASAAPWLDPYCLFLSPRALSLARNEHFGQARGNNLQASRIHASVERPLRPLGSSDRPSSPPPFPPGQAPGSPLGASVVFLFRDGHRPCASSQ